MAEEKGAVQQRRTSLNVFEDSTQGESHGNRSRRRYLSRERMDALRGRAGNFGMQVKIEYRISKQGVIKEEER